MLALQDCILGACGIARRRGQVGRFRVRVRLPGFGSFNRRGDGEQRHAWVSEMEIESLKPKVWAHVVISEPGVSPNRKMPL